MAEGRAPITRAALSISCASADRRPAAIPFMESNSDARGTACPLPHTFRVEWEEIRDRYPDGDDYALRRPAIQVSELAYGPLDPRRNCRFACRLPSSVSGCSKRYSDQEIRRFADPDDADGDGVSGEVQEIRDAVTGRSVPGRFGWKASQASLAAQSAAALIADMGVIPPGASSVIDRVARKDSGT